MLSSVKLQLVIFRIMIFLKIKLNDIAIVIIITTPPIIVSMLGCSFITNQTHKGPNIVSRRKNRLTSAAVIYLGAIVTRTNGIATHITHIRGHNYNIIAFQI